MSKRKPSNEFVIKEHVFEIATLIISLVALSISIRSCAQAERSLDLAEEEFTSQRLAVWNGIVDEENKRLKLSSISEDVELQFAYVYFPPQLDDSEYTVSPPDFYIPLTYLSMQLENFVVETIELKPETVVVGDNKFVPIIIKSTYVAQGKLYEETALYYIKIMFVTGADNKDKPSISFDGLLFGNRIDSSTNIHEYLKNEWSTYIKSPPNP